MPLECLLHSECNVFVGTILVSERKDGKPLWRCVVFTAVWNRAPDLLKDHSIEAIVMG